MPKGLRARIAAFTVFAAACLGSSPPVWPGAAAASPGRRERSRTIVGEEVRKRFETPHPYSGAERNEPALVARQEIRYPGASYIAPHFSRFGLAEGDYVIVRSPDGARSWRYERQGEGEGDGFWGIHIEGDVALVELYSRHAVGGYGYVIDRFARGFSAAETGPEPPIEQKSICGADDSQNAVCYQVTEPAIYGRARAVARLLINGTSTCTGWLVGEAGHVMTNDHCVGNADEAANTSFEFMAEGVTCDASCPRLACPGTVVATSSTLVKSDRPRDYALLLLPVNVSGTYGYLQMRRSGPVLDERIYIPGHPGGRGKRIAVFSDQSPSGYAEVSSVIEPACVPGGPPDVGYLADTEFGSSGSPVLGHADHLVVALHHCAGCIHGAPMPPNRGVPIQEVIDHLGGSLPPCATCVPPAAPAGLVAAVAGSGRVDLAWAASPGATAYDLYRGVMGCAGVKELIAAGVAATTYSDASVTLGSNYSYVVRAVNASGGCLGCSSAESPCATVTAAIPALDFFTVPPCRLIDTRSPAGPLGGPALAAGVDRIFALAGECEIPAAAQALSANIAVTAPAAAGNLRLFPTGSPFPGTSALNFSAAQTRANNAIVGLGPGGELTVRSSVTTHFVLDVNGYFE